MSVIKYADDKQLNDELKKRERWNDPATEFLFKKHEGKSVIGKPLYQSPAASNHYSIKSEHWWDEMNRSNDFEKKWFAVRNKRANIKKLEYI